MNLGTLRKSRVHSTRIRLRATVIIAEQWHDVTCALFFLLLLGEAGAGRRSAFVDDND